MDPKGPDDTTPSGAPKGPLPDATVTLRSSVARSDRRIGPYRLLREIGHGGMGTVFLAARDDAEFEKKVAIKVVRGPDSDEVLARFRRERQILAGLEHPNIARLLDGGTTEDGLPYLVMEYVEGERIDRYCDEHHVGIRHRLEMFRGVCAAVAYAHRNLVVHRDLKPANILVTTEGMPKLLDFGIAKLLGPVSGGAGDTLLAMTPDYASPEQVRARPLTTATDVYSLGVILYELLTGVRPYRVKTSEPMEVLRAVCEQEPEAPSTAVVRGGSRPGSGSEGDTDRTPEETGRLREETPARLRKRLRGDLDAIVLSALQKEPERRYASVDAFSEDIGRYLEGRPVQALRSSRLYRLRKLASRHAVGLGAAALVLVLLVGLAVTMTVAASRLRRERDRVTAENAKVTAMNAFLKNALGAADPWERGSHSVLLVDALRQAQGRVESSFRQQPLIGAAVLQTIGSTFSSLADFADGERALRTSLELRRGTAGPRSAEVAETLEALADLQRGSRQLEDAERSGREALAIRREVDGPSSLRVAGAVGGLAETLIHEGKADEARALAEEMLRIARAAPRTAGASSDRTGQDAVGLEATALGHLALLASREGNRPRALALAQERLALLRRTPDRPPMEVAIALNDLGTEQYLSKQPGPAVQSFRDALATEVPLLGDDHPEMASVRENLAGAYEDLGRKAEAEALLRQVLWVRVKALGEDSEPVARTRANLATGFVGEGRWKEAEEEYRRAVPVLLAKSDPLDAAYVQFKFGQVLRHDGKREEAAQALRSALGLQAKALTDAHDWTQKTLSELVAVTEELGRTAEAAALRARLVPKKK